MIVKEGRTEAVRKKAIKLAASLGIQGSIKTGKLIARQFGNTGKSLLTAAQKAKISKIANRLGGVVKMYGNVVSAYQITNSIVEAIRGGKSPEQAIKEIGDVLIPIPGYLDLFIATMKRRPKMSEYRKELFGNQEHSSWFGR